MLFYFIILYLFKTVFSCPDVIPDVKFNISVHKQGRWYKVARYKFDLEENADGITYNFDEDGKLTIQEIKNNSLVSIHALVNPTQETGKVTLHTDESAVPNVPVVVLATYNTHYVIFYSCIDSDETKSGTEFSWIVSRTPTMGPELKSMIHKYMDEIHIVSKETYRWDHLEPEDCVIKE